MYRLAVRRARPQVTTQLGPLTKQVGGSKVELTHSMTIWRGYMLHTILNALIDISGDSSLFSKAQQPRTRMNDDFGKSILRSITVRPCLVLRCHTEGEIPRERENGNSLCPS